MLEKEKERSALKRTYHPAQEKRVHLKGVVVVANKKMEENNRNGMNEIKEKLGINKAVAEEAKVGTKKGIKFEQEIIADLQSWQKFPTVLRA